MLLVESSGDRGRAQKLTSHLPAIRPERKKEAKGYRGKQAKTKTEGQQGREESRNGETVLAHNAHANIYAYSSTTTLA